MRRILLVILLLATSSAFAAQEVAVGCKRLRLVLDERLNDEAIAREWGSGNDRTERPAALELIGCKGEVLDHMTLAAPLARLDPVPVRGARYPTYLASADLTADAGSYSGPLTIPVQVAGDRLITASAQLDGKRREPIRLATTGKAAWRKVEGARADQFLQVSCQPAKGGFRTTYRRYFLAGREWRARTRMQAGLWESDGEFPARTQFP